MTTSDSPLPIERALVLDLETVPDLEGGRRLLGLPEGAPATEIRAGLQEHYRPKNASADADVFIKPVLHKIAVIGFVEAHRTTRGGAWTTHRIVSVSSSQHSEAALIRRLSQMLGEEPLPLIVGWNTSGFDLPVLRYRAMALAVPARPLVFRYPEDTPKFRWPENPKPRDYWKRYGDDHVDLMDLLCGYGASTKAKLNEVAAVLGLPGKVGMDGSEVETAIGEGRHQEVCQYCEGDVVLLYAVWLRYLMVSEELSAASYNASVGSLANQIRVKGAAGEHLTAFTRVPAIPAGG